MGKPLIRPHKTHATTADIDYSDREFEFLKAIDKYKRETGKKFISNTEYLKILTALGYRKIHSEKSNVYKEIRDQDPKAYFETRRPMKSEIPKILSIDNIGVHITRKFFDFDKAFDLNFGIYLGEHVGEYAVGVLNYNSRLTIKQYEIYLSFNDLQSEWETNDVEN